MDTASEVAIVSATSAATTAIINTSTNAFNVNQNNNNNIHHHTHANKIIGNVISIGGGSSNSSSSNSNSSCSSSSTSSNSSGYGSTTTTPTNNYDLQQTTPRTTPVPTTPVAIPEHVIPVATVAAVAPFYSESLATHNLEAHHVQRHHLHHTQQQQHQHQQQQQLQHQQQHHLLQNNPHHFSQNHVQTNLQQQHHHHQYLSRQQYYSPYDYQQTATPTHNLSGSTVTPPVAPYNMVIPGPGPGTLPRSYELSSSPITPSYGADTYKSLSSTVATNYERSATVKTNVAAPTYSQLLPQSQHQLLGEKQQPKVVNQQTQHFTSFLSSSKQRLSSSSTSLISNSTNTNTSKPQATATPFYANPTPFYDNYKHKMPLDFHDTYGSPSPATAASAYQQHQKYYAAAKSQLKEASSYGPSTSLNNKSLYPTTNNFFPGPTAGLNLTSAPYDKYMYSHNSPTTYGTSGNLVSEQNPTEVSNYRKPVVGNSINSPSWPWSIDYASGNSRTIPPPASHLPTATVAPTHATHLPQNPTVLARDAYYMGTDKFGMKYDKYNAPAYQQSYVSPPANRHIWPNTPHASNLTQLNERHILATSPPTIPSHSLHTTSYFPGNSSTGLSSRQSCCSQSYQPQSCYYPPTHPVPPRLPHSQNPPASYLTAQQTLGQSPHLNALSTNCKYGGVLSDFGGGSKIKSSNDLYLNNPHYDNNPALHNFGYGTGQNSQQLYATNVHQPLAHESTPSSLLTGDPLNSTNPTSYTNDLNLTTSNFDNYHAHFDTSHPSGIRNQEPPAPYGPTVAKRALLDYRKPIQPQPPPTIAAENCYTTLTSRDHYMQHDLLNTPENTTAFGEYDTHQNTDTSLSAEPLADADTAREESNKNLSLRDFIANWNDDEDEYQNNEEMSFNQNHVIDEVLQTAPVVQEVLASESVAAAPIVIEEIKVIKSCTLETKSDARFKLSVKSLDSLTAIPSDADTNQYVNLPDIVIDIEKQNNVNSSITTPTTTPTPPPAHVEANDTSALNLTNFDVEKELDELNLKKPAQQQEFSKDLSDIRDAKTIITPQLSPCKNLSFEDLNLESTNKTVHNTITTRITNHTQRSELNEPYFKDIEGYESSSSRHSNESAFEKEYETFIHKITSESSTNSKVREKKDEADTDTDFTQNVREFSKFHKGKRKLKESDPNSAYAEGTQSNKKIKSTDTSVVNHSNFPKVYTRKSRYRINKCKIQKPHRRKPLSAYYKIIHSIRRYGLHRKKRVLEYMTELKEKHLPLIKRQSIKNYTHETQETLLNAKSLKALCIMAINTEEFRQSLILTMSEEQDNVNPETEEKNICPDPTCETCEVIRSLMAPNGFETTLFQQTSEQIEENIPFSTAIFCTEDANATTMTILQDTQNIIDLDFRNVEHVMISNPNENVQYSKENFPAFDTKDLEKDTLNSTDTLPLMEDCNTAGSTSVLESTCDNSERLTNVYETEFNSCKLDSAATSCELEKCEKTAVVLSENVLEQALYFSLDKNVALQLNTSCDTGSLNKEKIAESLEQLNAVDIVQTPRKNIVAPESDKILHQANTNSTDYKQAVHISVDKENSNKTENISSARDLSFNKTLNATAKNTDTNSLKEEKLAKTKQFKKIESDSDSDSESDDSDSSSSSHSTSSDTDDDSVAHKSSKDSTSSESDTETELDNEQTNSSISNQSFQVQTHKLVVKREAEENNFSQEVIEYESVNITARKEEDFKSEDSDNDNEDENLSKSPQRIVIRITKSLSPNDHSLRVENVFGKSLKTQQTELNCEIESETEDLDIPKRKTVFNTVIDNKQSVSADIQTEDNNNAAKKLEVSPAPLKLILRRKDSIEVENSGKFVKQKAGCDNNSQDTWETNFVENATTTSNLSQKLKYESHEKPFSTHTASELERLKLSDPKLSPRNHDECEMEVTKIVSITLKNETIKKIEVFEKTNESLELRINEPERITETKFYSSEKYIPSPAKDDLENKSKTILTSIQLSPQPHLIKKCQELEKPMEDTFISENAQAQSEKTNFQEDSLLSLTDNKNISTENPAAHDDHQSDDVVNISPNPLIEHEQKRISEASLSSESENVNLLPKLLNKHDPLDSQEYAVENVMDTVHQQQNEFNTMSSSLTATQNQDEEGTLSKNPKPANLETYNLTDNKSEDEQLFEKEKFVAFASSFKAFNKEDEDDTLGKNSKQEESDIDTESDDQDQVIKLMDYESIYDDSEHETDDQEERYVPNKRLKVFSSKPIVISDNESMDSYCDDENLPKCLKSQGSLQQFDKVTGVETIESESDESTQKELDDSCNSSLKLSEKARDEEESVILNMAKKESTFSPIETKILSINMQASELENKDHLSERFIYSGDSDVEIIDLKSQALSLNSKETFGPKEDLDDKDAALHSAKNLELLESIESYKANERFEKSKEDVHRTQTENSNSQLWNKKTSLTEAKDENFQTLAEKSIETEAAAIESIVDGTIEATALKIKEKNTSLERENKLYNLQNTIKVHPEIQGTKLLEENSKIPEETKSVENNPSQIEEHDKTSQCEQTLIPEATENSTEQELETPQTASAQESSFIQKIVSNEESLLENKEITVATPAVAIASSNVTSKNKSANNLESEACETLCKLEITETIVFESGPTKTTVDEATLAKKETSLQIHFENSDMKEKTLSNESETKINDEQTEENIKSVTIKFSSQDGEESLKELSSLEEAVSEKIVPQDLEIISKTSHVCNEKEENILTAVAEGLALPESSELLQNVSNGKTTGVEDLVCKTQFEDVEVAKSQLEDKDKNSFSKITKAEVASHHIAAATEIEVKAKFSKTATEEATADQIANTTSIETKAEFPHIFKEMLETLEPLDATFKDTKKTNSNETYEETIEPDQSAAPILMSLENMKQISENMPEVESQIYTTAETIDELACETLQPSTDYLEEHKNEATETNESELKTENQHLKAENLISLEETQPEKTMLISSETSQSYEEKSELKADAEGSTSIDKLVSTTTQADKSSNTQLESENFKISFNKTLSSIEYDAEKDGCPTTDDLSEDFCGFKHQSSFEDESEDFHGFEDLEEVTRIRQEIENLNYDSTANDGFVNNPIVARTRSRSSASSLNESLLSELNDLEALEKELTQPQTEMQANDETEETEKVAPTKYNENEIVFPNDIEHIKQMLESDEEPQIGDGEHRKDKLMAAQNCKDKFLENNSKNFLSSVNSIIPKLSDLCRAALNSSLNSNSNLAQQHTKTSALLVESELSVEEALAEMYRQAGVLLSDPEEYDNDMPSPGNSEAHDVLLINLQEILNSDNNEVYVLQCDMNENVLNVVQSTEQHNEDHQGNAERVNATVQIILGTQNTEQQIHIISSDSESDVIILSDDESDVNCKTLQVEPHERIAIPFINDDNINESDSCCLFDISTIHHEEIVPENLKKFLQEEFYKYLHEKYVQRNISKYYHANRILKKYKRIFLRARQTTVKNC